MAERAGLLAVRGLGLMKHNAHVVDYKVNMARQIGVEYFAAVPQRFVLGVDPDAVIPPDIDHVWITPVGVLSEKG
ncbi:hypothetical protein [Nocardia concava]|uniref:hypothetical protein n=1 Tax=Nocardia concava TaxID=257281 RepID=UPI0012FAD2A8|nr:hypothetical protein [Nocardia concava]